MSEEKMFGWNGTILRVDLTKGKASKQPLNRRVARDLIGGRGLAIKTLFDEIEPGIDPLGPRNVLCLSLGPLTGTILPLTSRLEVSALSPYSGILGDGNSGGYFPAELKFAGYDQIVVTGRADKPKYLWIEDENVELRDASDLWGKTIWETTDILERDLGRRVKVACIGQAGENLVRVANTISDRFFSAARGSGAVWGSKNLKAIAVRGTKRVKMARPDEFSKLAKEDREFLMTDEFQQGTIGKVGTYIGMMKWEPSYRHAEKYLLPEEVPDGLTPEGLLKYEVRRMGCYNCPVYGKGVFEIPAGKYKGERGACLEFETLTTLGTGCGIMEPEPIMVMLNLCDKYGMCTVALGNTIALAKDLYNRGIITKKDTGGMSLEWEDAESQIELVHKTARREGFGNMIAEGLYSFAKIIGGRAMDYRYHTKGLSRDVFPPGNFTLSHATSTRGADHLRGRSWTYSWIYPEWFKSCQNEGMIPKGLPELVIFSHRVALFPDLTGRCKCGVNNYPAAIPLVFKRPFWDGCAKLLSAATGLGFDAAKITEVADRVYNLERAFNVRQGITRKHDNLPQKPWVRETPKGREEQKEHEKMLTEYYKLRGWDVKTGIPKRETLEQFGLKYVADEIEEHAPYPEWDGPPLWPLDKYPHG